MHTECARIQGEAKICSFDAGAEDAWICPACCCKANEGLFLDQFAPAPKGKKTPLVARESADSQKLLDLESKMAQMESENKRQLGTITDLLSQLLTKDETKQEGPLGKRKPLLVEPKQSRPKKTSSHRASTTKNDPSQASLRTKPTQRATSSNVEQFGEDDFFEDADEGRHDPNNPGDNPGDDPDPDGSDHGGGGGGRDSDDDDPQDNHSVAGSIAAVPPPVLPPVGVGSGGNSNGNGRGNETPWFGLPKPEAYDGKGTRWKDWEICFRKYLELRNTPKEKWGTLLWMSTKGQVREHVNQVMELYSGNAPYDFLCEEINAAFGEKKTQAQLMTEFNNRTFRCAGHETESLKEFSSTLYTLGVRAYADRDVTDRFQHATFVKKLVKNTFIARLPRACQLQVIAEADSLTYEEVVTQTTSIWEVEERHRQLEKEQKQQKSEAKGGNFKRGNWKPRGNFRGRGFRPWNRNRGNFANTGETGVQNPQAKQGEQVNPQSFKGGGQRGGSVGRGRGCYNCGQFGHLSRNCTKPRKQEQAQGGQRGPSARAVQADQQLGAGDFQMPQVQSIRGEGDVEANAVIATSICDLGFVVRAPSQPVILHGKWDIEAVPACLDTGCEIAAVIAWEIVWEMFCSCTEQDIEGVFFRSPIDAFQAGHRKMPVRSAMNLIISAFGTKIKVPAVICENMLGSKLLLGPQVMKALGYRLLDPNGVDIFDIPDPNIPIVDESTFDEIDREIASHKVSITSDRVNNNVDGVATMQSVNNANVESTFNQSTRVAKSPEGREASKLTGRSRDRVAKSAESGEARVSSTPYTAEVANQVEVGRVEVRQIASDVAELQHQMGVAVRCKVPDHFKNQDCYFQTTPLMQDFQLNAVEGVVRPDKDGHFWVTLDNYGADIDLPEYFEIGTVEPVDKLLKPDEFKNVYCQKILEDVDREAKNMEIDVRYTSFNPNYSSEEYDGRIDLLLQKLNMAESDLAPQDRSDVENFFADNNHVFALGEGELGCCDWVLGEINTQGSDPIKIPPRRIPWVVKKAIEKQIELLLQMDIIEESKSPYSFPIVPIRKKDGSVRIAVDYRALNKVIKKEAVPLPRPDEIIDSMGEVKAKWFSKCDLKMGYHQVLLSEDAKEKTAFSTHFGLFQYKRLPLGVSVAPQIFVRLMNRVLHGLIGKNIWVYLDDILIASETINQHKNALRQLFDRLEQAGLRLKPDKCEFFRKEVTFLGFVLSEEGILPDPALIDKVKNFPEPKTVKGIRTFMGLCQYLRKTVKGFSLIAKPLYALTSPYTQPFKKLPDDAKKAFEVLKDKLTHPPVLAYPDYEKEFIVETDACPWGIGALLGQKDEQGRFHPIAYASRRLNEHESKYGISDLEGMAVVWAIKHWDYYLKGRKIRSSPTTSH